ncbi:GNAT family N-acetyltransferase [Scytonema millei]|uniref:GNAT family N-acetyltransferase n=1 Tax=Scytonema millei VB511283 TaxID=1245923 RepID=A0A9X5EB19_9CYAN|nr:GNAT family N-acetyltransferase [Scytonema millei]NHC37249.1 GNAT family N-acetyltransferase [Scytonema millei VB511283]
MEVSIRELQESELPAADRVFKLAFGTFIGLPDPMEFGGDANFIRGRWHANPSSAFAAIADGIIGSNLATRWGSCASFGPLSVHPDWWNQKIAQRLIEPVVECFDTWNIHQAGLFTFPNSSKHHALYQKFGFWQRFLTVIMAKTVQQPQSVPQVIRYSQMDREQRSSILKEGFTLTDNIYPGLDLSPEIITVHTQKLGDTVFFGDEKGLAGLAVCHCGAGTEAGGDTCYVKFGAVRLGQNVEERFEQLLDLCETLTVQMSMSRLVAGVNTSHHEAYRRMIARDFRTEITGVAMHRPNQSGYHRPDIFVLDDWR